jgi:hypothetical protein
MDIENDVIEIEVVPFVDAVVLIQRALPMYAIECADAKVTGHGVRAKFEWEERRK